MTMLPENSQVDSPPTAESRGEQTIALQSWLTREYPSTFNRDAPVPLKIGIHLDLLARNPDLDPIILVRAMTRYCARPRYQRALAREGAVRVDLDGNPAGDVEESHRKFAQVKLAHWQAKQGTKSGSPAIPAPEPVPTPAPTPPTPAVLAGRPILRLKKPSPNVVAAVVTRRAQP